jgi:NitT/TauT family transport system substrate-binding protein
MKKTLSMLLILSLLAALLIGCSSGSDTAETTDTTEPTEQVSDQTESIEPEDLPAEETETPTEETPEEVTEPETVYEPVDMNVAVLKGPTGMGMAKLMADSENGEAANNYTFTVDSDTSAVLTKLIAGEYDIAALPTNTAAVANAKTEGGIQMLALNTMGTLYLLENTEGDRAEITSLEDLRGATITLFGQGANPEYVLTYVLESAGLTVGEDVTLDFCSAVDEVLAKIASGDWDYALLPEPNATVAQTKSDYAARVMDMNAAWEEASGGQTQLVMGCLAVRAEFAQEHPEAVAKFLEEYQASVEYISTADDAAAIIAAEEIVPSEAIAAKALPNANIVCITGDAMQQTVEGYYNVLFDFNPSAVGGAIPDASFYYLGE